MVAAPSGDLYAPFPRSQTIEEGFQSSEEGSDLHSPVFEVPYPQDVRYHLGHLTVPDVATTSFIPPSSFDARYAVQELTVQIPDAHLLETLQHPNSTAVQHLLPPSHSHSEYGLQQPPMLHMDPQPGRLQVPNISPVDEFAFNLPQTSLPEPHLSLSHEPLSSTSSRARLSMPSPEQKHQISPSTRKAAPASGGNATPSRPPRREASSTVIACRQCRARKIRCDSTRPVCHNCTRRNNECEYDAVPKRRGPDKRPGTRQRSCKKRPSETEPSGSQAKKRRKSSGDHEGNLIAFDVKENVTGSTKRSLPMTRLDPSVATTLQIPQRVQVDLETSVSPRQVASDVIYPKDEVAQSYRRGPPYPYDTFDSSLKAFARPANENNHRLQDQRGSSDLEAMSPDVEFSRKTFWDTLLDSYSSSREQSAHDLITDIEFLLQNSGTWLFFFPPSFVQDLREQHRRIEIQPALILACLALSNLMQSSELENGASGRARAVYYRNHAQEELNAACRSQNIDYFLAEAAFVIALFEMSSHPDFDPEQAKAALEYLDRIITVLSLNLADIADKDVSRFAPRAVPMVHVREPLTHQRRCSCLSLTTSPGLHLQDRHAYNFQYSPPWDPNWSLHETRQEECRRLCWAALTLVSSHTSLSAAFHENPLDLALAEPSNYALLFPGEVYERSVGNQISGQSPKDSIWALYCRSMLLWNSCVRQRDQSWTTDERAKFAVNAWTETQAVQDALDAHNCNMDTSLMYVTREYLYNTRMTVSYELRRSLSDLDTLGMPMFNRRQAEEWLYYQDQVAKRVRASVMHLGDEPGHLLSRRPFQATWFASQVAICLALWNYDRSLINALELAKSFLIPLDALNALWPCTVQDIRRNQLRLQIEEACRTAGITPPLPPELSLPTILLRTPSHISAF
ncbi:hypothetical protein K474DRAFT_1601483 [Panus rudis PR-1116 ss-1]|nr:hypothetical protein K474DRAFT_1601483 [Panus rudis PR-1116 ss-1]